MFFHFYKSKETGILKKEEEFNADAFVHLLACVIFESEFLSPWKEARFQFIPTFFQIQNEEERYLLEFALAKETMIPANLQNCTVHQNKYGWLIRANCQERRYFMIGFIISSQT